MSSRGIVIPWADNGNAHREAALDKVFDYMDGMSIPLVVTAMIHTEDWSPGLARNKGVQILRDENPDLSAVCFIDADTIVSHDQIEMALDWAEADPGLVYGYTIYRRLNKQGSFMQEFTFNGSMGCAAISLTCFDKVGGFDETFTGWGYEDLDFAQRCACHWPLRRVDGIATHLWHGDRNADDSPDDSVAAQVATNNHRFMANSLLNYQAVSSGREPVA